MLSAIEWYAERNVATAERFAMAILEAYDRIERFPYAGHPYMDDTRRMLMKPFPFEIVYRISTTGTIDVVAVAHTSRRSGYWLDPD